MCLHDRTPPAPEALSGHAAVAFTGVNVLPMIGDSVLWDQTVLVRDGLITAVGPAASTADWRIAQRGRTNRRGLVAALREAGARLAVGTDTRNPFVVPGFSVHE